jgi:glycosyltransferase involved in cell wall biosynthesis
MIVGVLNYRFDYYPYLRTIVHRVPGVTYQPVQDLYSNLNRAAKKVNRTVKKNLFPTFDLNNQFQDFGWNKVDLLHFFNGISYGRTPWVSHFETILPRLSTLVTRHQGEDTHALRVDARTRRALNTLSGSACKRLVALSECSRSLQLDLLESLEGIDVKAIQEKMIVLHPPQEAVISGYAEKKLNLNGKIQFMIVGAGFIRKGGREILRVFERFVREKQYPIELVIISSLRMDQYAAHETEEDTRWVKERIAANADWITHHHSLPNEDVLALMRSTHVGLLPTYADTYGYSVLEFQAAGAPVISTNVRALPEINPLDAGWLIEVPRNPLGEGLYQTALEREQLSQAIEARLESQLEAIFSDLDSITRKGKAALARIQHQHDPAQYGQQLGEIYQQALESA